MSETVTDSDLQLLARYTRDRAEDAFAEIVRRHLDLVHSAALRQVRSPQLAEEVAQSAFTDLARNARRLLSGGDASSPGAGSTAPSLGSLTPWLYQVTRRTAIDVVRREARRHLREQIATEMNAMNASGTGVSPVWSEIEPLLDEAMSALDDTDRAAVLLRYFENKSLREVGQRLGTSDDAAQKRVSRAVEHLREFFTKRGVTVGASGLVVVLSANAVQAAPVGLAVTISTAASIAAATLTITATAATTKAIAMTTLQKTLVAVTIVTGLTTPLVIQHQAQVKLREENQALRQQVGQLVADNTRLASRPSLTPHLPAPRLQVATSPAEPPTEDFRTTNLIARLLQLQAGDTPPKLTAAQIEPYLKENGRSAASLLAAFRATGDQALLQEAMQKYPDDPQVNFAAVVEKNSSPEERRQRLEAFKHAAPQNALANYLSALDYFKSGQADQAVQELNAASGKLQFQDYSADFVQNDEEAWRAAGYSVAESKTVASMSLMLPHLGGMKQLSQDMASLANSYRQAGDGVSAQTALRAALSLGQRLEGSAGQALVTQLTGVAIQSIALRAMDPTSLYGEGGQTVQGRLNELAQQREAIRKLTSQFDTVQQQMSDQDWISYKDRWRAFGEEAALRWMVIKYGQE